MLVSNDHSTAKKKLQNLKVTLSNDAWDETTIRLVVTVWRRYELRSKA